VTKTIDEILNESFEQEARERAERQTVLSDPFKKPKTEPGRARPKHGHSRRLSMTTSLGGEHS